MFNPGMKLSLFYN